jgi:hypothetical protein
MVVVEERMFRRRIKSALLVDFDNIVGATNGDFGRRISNWMAWLEDGKFDGGRRRRNFLVKRVYWHAQNDGYRPAFEGNGFEAITCRSFVDRKSTADMIIALDALEATYDQEKIQEYVLLTTDTDFVPLVQKLANRSKHTVNAGNKENLSYGVFADHADVVIPIDALKGAFAYERKSLLSRLTSRWQRRREQLAKRRAERKQQRVQEAARKAVEREISAPDKQAAAQPKSSTELRKKPLEAAAEHVARIGARSPGLQLGRRTINRALANHMPDYKTVGASAYLGCGSYNKMLERLASIRGDLRLHKHKRGGRSISFRPPN